MSDQHRDYARDRMLREHDPDEVGTWQILGEDPNCDFGGPHSEPHLATVEGLFRDAVDAALAHPRFFTWGGGGRVEKIEVKPARGGFTPPTGPAEPRPAVFRHPVTIVPSPRPEVEPPLPSYNDLLNLLCDEFHIPGSPTFREAVAYIKGMIHQAGQRR